MTSRNGRIGLVKPVSPPRWRAGWPPRDRVRGPSAHPAATTWVVSVYVVLVALQQVQSRHAGFPSRLAVSQGPVSDTIAPSSRVCDESPCDPDGLADGRSDL